MLALKGYFNGKDFIPLDKVNLKPNQKVIITVLDEYINGDDSSDRKESFLKTFGIWDDSRDADVIIDDIYSSRVSRKGDITL